MNTVCEECGGPLPPPKTSPRKFCSDQCNWRAQSRKKKARAKSRVLVDREPCVGCGGDIPPTRRKSKFCSNECGKAHLGRLRTLDGKGERNCTECSEPIPLTERRDTTVCSTDCHLDRENRRGRERYHQLFYGHQKFLNDPLLNHRDRYARAKAQGYRSGLEVKIARDLEAKGIRFGYETFRIPYTPPEKERTYTPDILLPNGIIVELKGRLMTEDRAKMKFVKAQHPSLDIRLVFSNAKARLSKGSKTTYSMWSDNYGFPWAHQVIPQEWLDEPDDPNRIDALLDVMRPVRTKVSPASFLNQP